MASPFPRRPMEQDAVVAHVVGERSRNVFIPPDTVAPVRHPPVGVTLRPVIARLPATLTEGVALEVLFRGGDQVDVRPADGWSWTPLRLCGGDVEVRVR